VYVFATSAPAEIFLREWAFRGDHSRFSLERLVDGTAHRPYVYRRLAPIAVRVVSAAVVRVGPPQLLERMERDSPLLRFRDRWETWNRRKAILFHSAWLVVFASLLGSAFAARLLLRSAGFPGEGAFTDYAPAIGLLLLPLSFLKGGYVYDAPELFLLLLATAFLLRSAWFAYYVVFALATLNKESAVFLVAGLCAVHLGRLPWRRLATHVGLHAVIGGAILVAVRYHFRDNPGPGVEYWLPTNIRFWIDPMSYLSFVPVAAPLVRVPRGANVILLFLLGMGVFYRWTARPRWLRRLTLTMAAVNLPLFLLFALKDEFRALGGMFPSLFVTVCDGVARLYGGPAASATLDESRLDPPADLADSPHHRT
jgi:hypothetical protein